MKYLLIIFSFIISININLYSQINNNVTDKKTFHIPCTYDSINISGNYRFVVLADRTGGGNYDTFNKAIAEVNKLSPDFVICVGDLIDGYVSERKYAESQWDELLLSVQKLNMPFFFVPGNHDLSSRMMTDIYKEKFGTTYFSFTAGDDLFLILNTEEEGKTLISDEQVEYFSNILNNWKGRWIYVFMHRPLWNPKNYSGYEKIDTLLQNHNYTVFSGHEHIYYMENRNGREYYTLATTGGNSELRNKYLGEFEHYMYVTACNPKPIVANIMLGSLLPNDIVSKHTQSKVNTLFYGGNININPTLCINGDSTSSFEFTVDISNPTSDTLYVRCSLPQSELMEIYPNNIDEIIKPNSDTTFKFNASINNNSISKIESQDIKFVLGYKFNNELVETNIYKRLLIDYIKKIDKNKKIAIVCNKPDVVKESWNWYGCNDGSFNINIEYTNKKVIINVKTQDDLLLSNRNYPYDKLEIYVSNDCDNNYEKYSRWLFNPDGKVEILNNCRIRSLSKSLVESNSIVAQLEIPINQFKNKSFMLNVSFTDSDSETNTKPSVLWWKPNWCLKNFNETFGIFKIVGRY